MMRSSTIIAFFVLSLVLEGVLAESGTWHWGYVDDSAPNYWLLHYEYCGGKSQSPIDLPLSEANYDPSHGKIEFTDYDTTNGNFNLLNNGHTVQVDITNSNHMISGAKLPAQYKLAQFHFHWGNDNSKGSEHFINGHQFPLEMHLVHYDKKYDGVGEAKDHPEGIAVLGVMFQIGEETHKGLDNVIQNLDKIKYRDQDADINPFPLADLLPDEPEKYFRYGGSLTTPPCSESVVWTVFYKPVTISQAQIEKFRSLFENGVGEDDHHLVNNFRPTQSLYARKIYTSFEVTQYVRIGQSSEMPEFHWGYEKKSAPNYWLLEYETCGGKTQSPIDVPLSETVFNATYGPLTFKGYDDDKAATFNLHNNGHSVQVDVINGSHAILGGQLPANYTLAQFHFHWGSDNSKGSEHLVDGKASPLEMHLVHYDSRYSGVDEAKEYPNGVAVLAVFFKVGEEKHEALDTVVEGLSMVTYEGEETELDTFPLIDLLPSDTSKYFRYSGSLTTPPCSETVVWTVFSDRVTISQDQLDQFRQMYPVEEHEVDNSTRHLVDNFRPPQPLFGRTIYSSFQVTADVQGDMPRTVVSQKDDVERQQAEHNAEMPEFHWGYEKKSAPNYWLLEYETCGGKTQSPIDVPLSETVYSATYGPLTFKGYDDDKAATFNLQNNGHSVQVDLINASHSVSGGKLPAQYKLAQFHFHWGDDNSKGSEHLIDGNQFPLEMHLVHYDDKYSGIDEAKDYPDGIAVVAVMFEIGDETHTTLDNIVKNLDAIRYKGDQTTIATFPLAGLLPDEPLKYFRYGGSLTTPPCSESVVWTVFYKPVTISQAQIDEFRLMYEDTNEGNMTQHLVNNYRPPQPLFGRKIYSSFRLREPVTAAKTSDANIVSLSLWRLGVIVIVSIYLRRRQ